MKTTKWDLFFQVLLFILLVGIIPALGIKYNLILAFSLIVAILCLSFITHLIQVKKDEKK